MVVKKKKHGFEKFGAVIFISGIILALIAGIVSTFIGSTITTTILIILGLFVGFLNVAKNEVKDYLLAAVSLVIVTSLGGNMLGNVSLIGFYLESVLIAMMTFVVPATIIVALKEIYYLAQD